MCTFVKLMERMLNNQPAFNMTTLENIKKAKRRLTMNQPFFATLALGLEYVENQM